jgi:hypothetical protein
MWKGAMGHWEIIHDLVFEGIAVEKIRARRLMAYSNWGWEHSIVRHLSIDDNKRKERKKRRGGEAKARRKRDSRKKRIDGESGVCPLFKMRNGLK